MMELRIKPLGLGLLLLLIAGGIFAATQFGGKKTDEEMARGEILLIGSKTKKDWLEEQAKLFQQKYNGRVTVKLEFAETRDSYQDILNGKSKPALWAPSSPVWVKRLGETKPGLLDTSDATGYRIYLQTPMVFLTTKDRATFLRPLLSQPNKTWANLHDLSMGTKKTPWGNFKFSYADPINAGSGFATLSMIVNEYATNTGQLGNFDKMVNDPKFEGFLKELNTNFVYDDAVEKGSTDLHKAFIAEPDKYQLICTYESNAIKSASEDPNQVAIYPNPTVTVDVPIVLLGGADWMSKEQKAAGRLFLKFLADKPAMQAGVATYFRPYEPTPDITLSPEIKKVSGQGFQETFNSTGVPPYDPVNEAAARWRRVTKGAPAPTGN